MSNAHYQEDQEEELNEEEIIQAILDLGNDILRNLGVEEKIEDVGVFFSDAFYIQFFQAAFPNIDFSQLQEAEDEEAMAQNIQALIDLLGQQILKHDLSHIKGTEIVSGNPEHCINLMQLVQEISLMLGKEEGSDLANLNQDQEDDEEEEEEEEGGSSIKKQQISPQQQEDDEAQILHERKQKKQESPGTKGQDRSNGSNSQSRSNQKRGRSHSDDRGKKQMFEMDDIDISNEFDVNMDEDDDENEAEMFHQQQMIQQQQRQQQQKQGQQQNNKSGDQSKQKIAQQQQLIDDEYQEDDDEEIDEDDLKMYEQFLANNKQQEQQLAMLINDNQPMQFGSAPGPQQMIDDEDPQPDHDEGEDEDEIGDIEDYDDLDPQILELAEQMGVHPKEVIKQILQLQQQEYGNEEGMDEEEEDEEQFHQQLQQQQKQQQQQLQQQHQNQLNQQQQQQKQQLQGQQRGQSQGSSQKKQPAPPVDDYSDEESNYTEGELMTRYKLANRKSYSAPYIIMNDCFDEPLYDSESQVLQKACSTTMLQNLELMEEPADDPGNGAGEGEDMDQHTAQLLMMQQQQLAKQQQQQLHNQQQKLQQQQQQQQNQKQQQQQNKKGNSQEKGRSSDGKKGPQRQFDDEDEEDEELDIDVKEKLMQLQQQQQQQQNMQEDDGEGEGEEDDEDMLIDLDQLDEENRQALLEYLKQEYEKNPTQFPFPKELIEDYMNKQSSQQQQLHQRQETESVRDIRSDEMIVEETSSKKIEGGGLEIEDEDQDQQHQLHQQLQMMQQYQQQQQQQNEQEYGQEEEEEQEDVNLMQHQQQPVYNQMMSQQPFKTKKPRKSSSKGPRPKSGGGLKKKSLGVSNQNVLSKQQQAQQDYLLQQQQYLANLLQQENIDVENIDPNLLQQLIIAQSQQQQQVDPQMLQQRPGPGSRPRTAKRKSSATKKKVAQKISTGKNLQTAYAMPTKAFKVLGPSTPGSLRPYVSSSKRTLSKKKNKSAKKQPPTQSQLQSQAIDEHTQQQLLLIQQQQQQFEMPVLSEEYLNQLSEEQLQQLLEQQQQLMLLQQQQQQVGQQPPARRSSRPKSAKTQKPKISKVVPSSYANYLQPLGLKRKSTVSQKPKKKKKKRTVNQVMDNQGVMLNNYFPALESNMPASQDMEHKYPGDQYIGYQQDPIDEVSPEQEEGESQENIQKSYGPGASQHPTQQEQYEEGEDNQDQDIEQEDAEGDEEEMDQDQADMEQQQEEEEVELSDEQLVQLIQNAHNLTPDQQQQLQLILQQKMQSELKNDRAQSYQNIYQILMDNVRKAKDRMANLGQVHSSADEIEETDRRIMRQKQEFEALYRQYQQETKQRETKKKIEDSKSHKSIAREQKIQTIKERRFQDDLLNHQKSLNFKRNAQQVKLCQKVYKLASELEKNKLLQEKKEYKEVQQKKKVQTRMMVDALETYYHNQIQMLKEKIESERFERKIAQQAQQHAMTRMKKELNWQKKREVEKYLQILQQEDQRYDFESTNLDKIQGDILKLYKKQ